MRPERDETCDTCWCWKRKRGCRTITREKDWWVFALGIGGRCPSWVPNERAYPVGSNNVGGRRGPQGPDLG